MYTVAVYVSISQQYILLVHIKGKRKKKFAKLGEKSDFIKKQSKVTQGKKNQINDV